MIEVGRSEQMIKEMVKEMDKLASVDHTYKANKEEIEFYRGNWWIHKKCGTCMNDSKDFRDAESICSGNSHVARGMGS